MESKVILRNGRIIIGLIIAISAIYANVAGTLLDQGTLQLVIVAIFAMQLMDAPKEE